MNFTKISRELLQSLKFRVMNDFDRNGFAGVSSPVPLIASNDDEGILVVIDGNRAELYAEDGCANFDCVDVCDNICDLPFKSQKQIKIEAEIEAMEKALENLKSQLAE